MKFIAKINVMPLKELLDPQGKTVANNLKNLEVHNVDNVRIGKHITLEVDAENAEAAAASVDTVCKKLLVNPVIEEYTYSLSVEE